MTTVYKVDTIDWNDLSKFPGRLTATHSFTNVNGQTALPGGVPRYNGDSPPVVSEQSALPPGEYYYRHTPTSVNMVLKSKSDDSSATSADVYQVTIEVWNNSTSFPDGPNDHP
jgi:hypothetical protein